MSGIGAIQPLGVGEAWQALLQAAALEAEPQPPTSAQALPSEAAPTAPLSAPPQSRPAELPNAPLQQAEPASAVLPLAPVLLQPLSLQHGPELHWRVQDAPAWRQRFDDARPDSAEDEAEDDAPPGTMPPAAAAAPPAWARALLARLHAAAGAPVSAPALRPCLQSWRVGLPVLVACPAGLASLQASRDAASWCWRRWPARWRAARPATAERWWAVRLGLGPGGRPRTLRELTAGPAAPAPGQVSCELRLDDAAPGLAQWTEVLVQAPASASLRALLGARHSLPWLLCNQMLWPREEA